MQCLQRAVPWRLQYDSILKRMKSLAAGSKIRIPNRIERTPTDILEALESTVGRQSSAPHYKFLDDPYLLPISKIHYRTYPMAREAGKKAAMWVYQEHSELFEKNIAQPPIPAFQPCTKYTDASQVSEETLKTLIDQGKVDIAIEVYNLLNGDVSDETKLSLLEFLCFSNGQEAFSEELYEHRWVMKESSFVIGNTWNDVPTTREIFQELIKKGPELQSAAYSAYISGMAKHFHVSKAWELFTSCQEQNIPLSLHVYNYLLPTVPIMERTDIKRKARIIDMFKLMCKHGIQPNVNTLNGALYATMKIMSPDCQQFAMRLFTNFRNMGIEPCLTSYYLALFIFGKHGKSLTPLLNNIMDDLQGREIEIKNLNDTLFFAMAMNVAADEYSLSTANKVHALYLTKKNYKFVNKGYQESLYYRYYTLVQLHSLDITQFFDIYNEIVPNVYVPEPDVMEQILQALEICSTDHLEQYLPLLWPHIIKFQFVERPHLLLKMLQMTEKVMIVLDSLQRTELATHVLTVWKVLMEMNAKQDDRMVINIKAVGAIAVIFANTNLLEESANVVAFLVKNMNVLSGGLSKEHINELYDFYVSNEFSDGAMLLVQYLMNMESEEAIDKAKLLNQKLSLTKSQKDQLYDMFGPEVFESSEESQSMEDR